MDVLEVVVALIAGMLLLSGVLIMAGPSVKRGVAFVVRRATVGWRAAPPPAPPADVHPTTGKALALAARLGTLLKDSGMERHAAALRNASRRLQVEEANGIYAMLQVHRHLRGIRLADRADQEIFEGLLGQLRKALTDRAEQLELLPRS
jgi:hypothetical protein